LSRLDALHAGHSVDAVVTDPPYGLTAMPESAVRDCLTAWLAGEPYKPKGKGFMGKAWDAWVPGPEVWREVLRVAKPGAHILCFAGTRTVDLMGIAFRLGGWEVRDGVVWAYGQGFPKSLDVSKAIDKAVGEEREVVGPNQYEGRRVEGSGPENGDACYDQFAVPGPLTAPATDAAKQWDGWGTALKPAVEPVILARKPLSEATVAANVLKWGTGAINVDGCRIPYSGDAPSQEQWNRMGASGKPGCNGYAGQFSAGQKSAYSEGKIPVPSGRFPANLIHDGSPEVTAPLGSAARFFYTAKASKEDRDGSPHPTMKPTDLMRYLCRLITPPGGLVLDPFAGSGSRGKGALLEGFRAVLIEREPEYAAIARARCQAAQDTAEGDLFTHITRSRP
jgi:DNA modification methylase